MGFEVLLVGRLRKDSPPMDDRPYATKRLRLLFEKGPLFYAAFNLRLFFFLLFNKAEVLVANDLDALLANVWAVKFKKATLVYDTHEYFTEVPELVARPKVQRVWRRIERSCFKRLNRIYTVNQSIADLYERDYGKPLKVVRNIPRKRAALSVKSKAELKLPEDRPIIILQGAWINVDRGGEEAVQAMQYLDHALLLIIGGGDVIEELKRMRVKLGLEDRITIMDRMPYEQLFHYTANADVGLTLDKDTNINYRYSLPNKLFDYLHAGTAVLASNLVEIRRVVEGHGAGEIVENHNPKAIAAALQNMLEDKEKLRLYQKNALEASEKLTWENEEEVLREIYLDLL